MNQNSREKIPVFRTSWQVLAAPFRHAGILFHKLWAPVLAFLVLANLMFVALNSTGFSMSQGAGAALYILLALLIGFVLLACFANIAVNCHRTFLLDGDERRQRVRNTPREWRFLGWLLVLGLIFMFLDELSQVALKEISSITISMIISKPTAVFSLEWKTWLKLAGMMMLVLFPVWLWVRLGLVYPATAVDDSVNIKIAWRLSKQNSLRLLVVAGLLPLVVFFIVAGASKLFMMYVFPLQIYRLAFINYGIMLFLLISVIEIAALSYTYRVLSERQAAQTEPAR